MSHDDPQPTDDSEQHWWQGIDHDRLSRRRLLYVAIATAVGIVAALFGIDQQSPQGGYGTVPYGRDGFGE